MNKIISLSLILTFLSCKDQTDVNPKATKQGCPQTTVTFDYELKDVKTGEQIILTDQELPNSPDCILKPGDTLRLCKSYGEQDWHTELYYQEVAEVDHCEKMKDAILISIKKVSYHYKE